MLNSLDNDSYVVRGREAKTIDKSSFRKSADVSSRGRKIKVRKIVGLEESLDSSTSDNKLLRPEGDQVRKVRRIKRYQEEKEPQKSWVKTLVIGGVLFILISLYVLYTYKKIQGMY